MYEDGDFPTVTGSGEGAQSESYEQTIAPLMDVFLNFRDKIKTNAGADKKVLFDLCDQVRDDILPYLGIQLEDKKQGESSVWKYEDKEVLLKRKEEKDAKKAKAAEEKRKKEEAADIKKRQASTPGKDWFITWETDKYSKFDPETGLPTHDIKDKKLNDQQLNGLKKMMAKQQSKYEKSLKEPEVKVKV